VLDGNLEVKFVQVANATNSNGQIWLKVARVFGRADKLLHLLAQQLDVFEGSVVRDVKVDDFLHCLAPGHILDPKIIQDDVGYLNDLHFVNAGEDGVEKRDFVDGKLGAGDVDAVADVVGMLDEEEDAGAKELLRGHSKDERQREESSSGGGESGDEAALEEGNYGTPVSLGMLGPDSTTYGR
jgi:hypothetical protein